MGRAKPRSSFDDLPLFATDQEIGAAVVGADRATHWAKVTVKRLELLTGFPKFDAAHGGRYTPGVRKYYEAFHGSEHGKRAAVEEKPENPGAWKNDRRSKLQG